MTRVDDQLAALSAMSQKQLHDEWQRYVDTVPPNLPTDLLRRLLGHQVQLKRHGGIPAAITRELARTRAGDEQISLRPPVEIRAGTRFVREWHGQTISAMAVEGGFIWNDRHYLSLTAIAREVTGARWSGPRFFGLVSRAGR